MTKQTLKNNSLGLKWIWLAFLFFMNPNVSVIDVMPDFIGYFILCVCLSKLADLNESVEDALTLFRKMILVDMGKWLAILWVFGLAVPSERNSSLLLFTFGFSVAEALVLIPAYSKLFYGITQLGYFFPNTSILHTQQQEGKKTRTDKIKRFTLVFVLMKAILVALPEFAELTKGDYSDAAVARSLYEYIGVMRLFAFVPVLIVGVLWFFAVLRYFTRIRKDRALISEMEKKYVEAVLPKKGLFVRRSFNVSYLLVILGLILSADFRLENRNVLPDFLVPIAIFLAFRFLGKHVKLNKPLWMGSTAAYGILSVVAYVLELRFFKEYYYEAIIRNEEASVAYRLLSIFELLKALSFLIMMWVLIRALYQTVLAHTGYVAGREHVSERDTKMIGDIHKEQWNMLLYAFISSVLYAASDLCFVFLAPEYGFVGLINLIFAVICLITFYRTLSTIQDAIQTKYMLE